MVNLKLKVQARELPARLLNPVETWRLGRFRPSPGTWQQSPADKGSYV